MQEPLNGVEGNGLGIFWHRRDHGHMSQELLEMSTQLGNFLIAETQFGHGRRSLNLFTGNLHLISLQTGILYHLGKKKSFGESCAKPLPIQRVGAKINMN
jgi:hypothetical protein